MAKFIELKSIEIQEMTIYPASESIQIRFVIIDENGNPYGGTRVETYFANPLTIGADPNNTLDAQYFQIATGLYLEMLSKLTVKYLS